MGLDAPALEEQAERDEYMTKKPISRILLLTTGAVVLVIGITLVLFWWPYVIFLFKGVVGAILALAGMGILYLVREK